MRPYKIGQIARFHTPLPDEDPNQLYVVLEVIVDVERPRAPIKALNGGLSFSSISTVSLSDLELTEVDTTELVGHKVTIIKSDNLQAIGRVIKVSVPRIMLDLTKVVKGVETNVWLTIRDKNGNEHTGTLFVN